MWNVVLPGEHVCWLAGRDGDDLPAGARGAVSARVRPRHAGVAGLARTLHHAGQPRGAPVRLLRVPHQPVRRVQRRRLHAGQLQGRPGVRLHPRRRQSGYRVTAMVADVLLCFFFGWGGGRFGGPICVYCCSSVVDVLVDTITIITIFIAIVTVAAIIVVTVIITAIVIVVIVVVGVISIE